MNRLVLIGNGFDIAHGLPTRYEDFITMTERWNGDAANCLMVKMFVNE